MYRPPGFKNPHQWYDMNRALMTFEINSQERYKAYEAGADAILEGLIRENLLDHVDVRRIKSKVVFIPEDSDGKE